MEWNTELWNDRNALLQKARELTEEHRILRIKYQPLIDRLSLEANELAEEFRRLYKESQDAFNSDRKQEAKFLSDEGKKAQEECEELNEEVNGYKRELNELHERIVEIYSRTEEIKNNPPKPKIEIIEEKFSTDSPVNNPVKEYNPDKKIASVEDIKVLLEYFSNDLKSLRSLIEKNISSPSTINEVKQNIIDSRIALERWKNLVSNLTLAKSEIIQLNNNSAKFIKETNEWLEYNEIILSLRDGHAFEKHSGKGFINLVGRMHGEYNEKKMRTEYSSSFTSEPELIDAVVKTIRHEKDKVKNWLKSGEIKLELEYRHSSFKGMLIPRIGGEHVILFSDKVKVVLIKKPSLPNGFRVLTAFPDV